MHTVLAGRASVSLSRIRRDHPEILAAAKPILVAAPGTLAALTEPGVLADVAILDACAHIPAIELLSHHRPRAAGGGDRPLRDGNQRKRQAADRHVASYRGGCCPISPCAAPVRIP